MKKETILITILTIITLFNAVTLYGSSVTSETLSFFQLGLFGISSVLLGAQIKGLKI